MAMAPVPDADTQVPAASGRRLGPDARRAQLVGVGLALVKTMRFDDTREAVVGIIAAALGFSELPAGLRLVFRGWIAMVEECILDWLDDKPVPREELLEFLWRAALTMLPDAL